LPSPFILFRELRRRRVFRVAGIYLVGAFTVLEVADVVSGPAGFPAWTLTALLYLLVLGFPLAVFLGWRYEIGDEGLVRTKPASADDVQHMDLSLRKSDYAIFAAIVIVAGAVAYQVVPSIRSQSDAAERIAEEARIARANSIAVLPFADLSPGTDHAYLADGLSDTVLHLLSQVNGLSVTARTSSFAFRDKAMDVAQIAAALGVRNILEGSVQRAGDQVRIIARLVDAKSGSERWSGNFDRELSGIFAIQDEIAREVVAAMKVNVMDDNKGRIEERYKPDLASYEQYVLGRRALLEETARGHIEAEEHFRRAIELDPNYADAYVGLARTYMKQSISTGRNIEEAVSLSRPLVDKALELDPLSSDAYAELAGFQVMDKNVREAEKSIRRAIELNPSSAEAHAFYAQGLWIMGRHEEALARARIAADLDPQSVDIQQELARILWSLARSEEAMSVIEDSIARDPEAPSNYSMLARWLKHVGKAGESMYYINKLHQRDPENRGHRFALCEEYLQLWDTDSAIACFESLIEDFPDDLDAKHWLASVENRSEDGVRFTEEMVRQQPTSWYRKAQLGGHLVEIGDWGRIIELYREAFPDLYADKPKITEWSQWPAMQLAQAWIHTGEQGRADRLLDAMLQAVLRSRKLRASGWGTGIEDVQIYSLQGKKALALDTLEAAIDSGWMFYTFVLHYDNSLDPLRDDPRFDALLEELGEELEEQRQWFEEHKDDPLPGLEEVVATGPAGPIGGPGS
jgi:TolB-like protein/Flp pilus assembly protein TadD